MTVLSSPVVLLLMAAQAPAQPVGVPSGPAPMAGRSTAYYHFSLGQQARMMGRYEEALSEYRRAQKADPRSGDIRAEVARLLREGGRLGEALEEAAAGTRVDPSSIDARVVLAQLYLAQAEAEQSADLLRKAAAAYEDVLRLDGKDLQTLRELAAIYAQLSMHPEAAGTWQRYIQIDPGQLEAHLQLGAHHLAQGDTTAAAEALKKAVEIEPSARAFQSLGDIYRAVEQNTEAARHYRSAVELDPRNPHLRLKLADTLFRDRQLEQALAEAETLLAADPDNRPALELKGRTLRDLKQFDKAQEVADQALGRDRADLSAAYLKATIAEARRDFAVAASELERLLSRSRDGESPEQQASNDRAFLLHLGLAYQQLGRHVDAADAFGRAFELTGRAEVPVLVRRIDSLVRAGQLDTALGELQSARPQFAGHAELVAMEATVLREKGQPEAAVQLIEQLRARAAGDVDTLLEVAEFYQRWRRFQEAESVLLQAKQAKPRDVRALFLLGAVLERQKRQDAAEGVFREALAVEPSSAPVLNYLGYMNADRGVKVEEAVTLIEKAVALDPENSAYLDSLGWAMFRLDRLEQAEHHIRRAIAKGTRNAVVLDHLGDVLARRGNIGEALEYWRRALEGEDEDGELDRARVERKIRQAQAGLDENARRERP